MKKKKKKSDLKKHIYKMILDLLNMSLKNDDFAKEYVNLAMKLSKKFNVKIPLNIKRKICKKCNRYFNPGIVRIKKGYIIYKCPYCGFEKWIKIENLKRKSILEKKDLQKKFLEKSKIEE